MSKDNLTSKVSTLMDLIAYQDGSLVSRTLIDKSAGTVTLFAFDAGQGLSEHTAPYDAMVYILDGQAQVTIAGNTLNLKAGETTIMPANQPHAVAAKNRFKMLLVMIKST